jgi:hypothetical protein
MRRELLFSIFALAMFAAFLGIANAQIKASITVKDSKGDTISGTTVLIGTTAYVSGYYEDQGGNAQASGLMEVYFNDGSGWKYKATIWFGNLNDGDTVIGTPYTMSELGSYEFRWTCQKIVPGSLTVRCEERTQTRTTIQLVVPEPGTLIGLSMALAAFGFLAIRRTRAK